MNAQPTLYSQSLNGKNLLLAVLFLSFLGFNPASLLAQKTFQATETQASKNLDKDIVEKIGGRGYKIYTLDLKALNQFLLANQGRPLIKFSIQLGNESNWNLELEPNDLRRLPGRKNYDCDTYKGIANSDPSNYARLLINERFIGGYVTVDKKRYWLTSLNDLLNSNDRTGQFLVEEFPHEKKPVSPEKFSPTCEEVFFEVGMHGSYALYLFKGGGNNPFAVSDVEDIIESLTNDVQGFYEEELGISFNLVIRGTIDGKPIVSTQPEPWDCCPHVSDLKPLLNGEWLMHRPCIPKDCIMFFAHENYSGAGASTGLFCNEQLDEVEREVAHVNDISYAGPDVAMTYAHEFGHFFGLYHIDENGSPCGVLCEGSTNPLICDSANDPNIATAYLDECSLEEIQDQIELDCETCMGPPEPLPSCPVCDPTTVATSDASVLLANCIGFDQVTINITVCNSCDQARDILVEAKFPGNALLVSPSNLGDFLSVVQVQGNTYKVTRNPEFFEINECKEYTFSAQVIGMTATNSIAVTPNVNGASGMKVQFYQPNFTLIGQNGQVSLLSLISSGLMPADGCFPSGVNVKNKEIFDKLEIDKSFYCMYDFMLKMRNGGEIIVKSGKTLKVKNTKFLSCDAMWKGIRVESGASLEFETSEISDAQFAIRAEHGAYISIKDCTFNKNYIGVFSNSGGVTWGPIAGIIIDGTEPLKAAFPGWTLPSAQGLLPHDGKAFAGVWAEKSHSVSPGSLHIMQGEFNPYSTFTGLRYGIHVKGHNLSVENARFSNVTGAGTGQQGYGIWAKSDGTGAVLRQKGLGKYAEASFVQCQNGIYSDGMAIDFVRDNNMIGVNTGIRVVDWKSHLNILQNNIHADLFGIRMTKSTPNATGLVQHNEILTASNNSRGIYLFQLGASPTIINTMVVDDNHIVTKGDNSVGIFCYSTNKADIVNNQIECLNENAKDFKGIRVAGDFSSNVNCNIVTGPGNLSEPNYGIDAWDAELTKYGCNSLDEMKYGVSFTMGSTSPENFKDTEFNTHDFGLRLSKTAAIGQQFNRGNRWLENGASGYGAVHEADDQFVVGQSDFFANSTSIRDYLEIFCI